MLWHDLPDAGLRDGDLGAVVHVSEDALEVEFVTASGRTQALLTVGAGDVRAALDTDLLTVRTTEPTRGARIG